MWATKLTKLTELLCDLGQQLEVAQAIVAAEAATKAEQLHKFAQHQTSLKMDVTLVEQEPKK